MVVLSAAKVGGIVANNSYPADFIRENLLIQTNVIDAAYRFGVERFCFLGSSCIYPKNSPQPIKEEYLLTSSLEETNEAYAVAKIAGLKMVQFYKKQYGFNGYSLMPTNVFGINDNFSLTNSHVVPALIRKFVEAKKQNQPVTLLGDGSARREFVYCDDLAEVIVSTLFLKSVPDLMNVGTGEDQTILELANLIKELVGFEKDILFDKTSPNGTPQKLLDISKMKSLGLICKTSLKDGLSKTIDWYYQQLKN